MGRDAASVAHDLGALLFVPAGMAALSVPVAAFAGDVHIVAPLVGIAAITGGTGVYLLRRFRHVRAEHRWPAVEVVAVGWLLSGLVTAAVCHLLGLLGPDASADAAFRDPMNALFEGMSGITSTGLTVVGGREAELTATAQWWRSLSQWVGGVGMVVFVLGFMRSATGMRDLYEAEARHPDLPGGMSGTVKRTGLLYLGLTAAAIVALALTEHDPWTAVNHGLTGISTGGFTITGDSLGGFGAGTQTVALIVIVVGAVPFVVHHFLLVRRAPAQAWKLTPLRAQLVVLVAGAAWLALVNATADGEVSVLDSVFQWVSAAGTAGFDTDPDLSLWATPALGALAVVMFVGAPSGSTGGGLKLDRVLWVAKATRRALGGDAALTWDGARVRRDRAETLVRHAAMLAGFWTLTLVLGCLTIAALTEAPLRLVVFDVSSALSNVGLSAGVVGPELGGASKAVFSAVMYLGRLELLTALVLATQREPA